MRTLFIAFMFLFLPSHVVFGAAQNAGAEPDSLSIAGAELQRSVPQHKYSYAGENGRQSIIYRGELRTSTFLLLMPPGAGLGIDVVNGISTGRWDVGIGLGVGGSYSVFLIPFAYWTVYATAKADIHEGRRSTFFAGADIGERFFLYDGPRGLYLRGFCGSTVNAQRNLSLCGGVSYCLNFVTLDATLAYKF